MEEKNRCSDFAGQGPQNGTSHMKKIDAGLHQQLDEKKSMLEILSLQY
jgi:hypothetical protein